MHIQAIMTGIFVGAIVYLSLRFVKREATLRTKQRIQTLIDRRMLALIDEKEEETGVGHYARLRQERRDSILLEFQRLTAKMENIV